MSALQSIIKHYEAHQTEHVHVKEWDLDIHFNKLTLRERDLIYKEGENHIVNALIYKAKDEKGKLLFTTADRHELMNKADPAIVARVALILLKLDSEEEAKND